jgi:hypothetical protein
MRTLTVQLLAVVLGLSTSGLHAQGTIVFNNLGNSDPSPYAQTSGLVFLADSSSFFLLNQDLNFELLAGPSTPSVSLIHSWLISNGTAKGIATGSGHFADPTGTTFLVPNVAANQPAIVEINTWVGNYPTFLSAREAGAPSSIIVFQYTTGGGGAPAPSLLIMPALVIGGIPEPSAEVIALLGVVVFGIARRTPASRIVPTSRRQTQWSTFAPNDSMETNCRVIGPLVADQPVGSASCARNSSSAAVAHFHRSAQSV